MSLVYVEITYTNFDRLLRGCLSEFGNVDLIYLDTLV